MKTFFVLNFLLHALLLWIIFGQKADSSVLSQRVSSVDQEINRLSQRLEVARVAALSAESKVYVCDRLIEELQKSAVVSEMGRVRAVMKDVGILGPVIQQRIIDEHVENLVKLGVGRSEALFMVETEFKLAMR
jgi:nitrogenase molybdenum-iron protein alpha/beta subunit